MTCAVWRTTPSSMSSARTRASTSGELSTAGFGSSGNTDVVCRTEFIVCDMMCEITRYSNSNYSYRIRPDIYLAEHFQLLMTLGGQCTGFGTVCCAGTDQMAIQIVFFSKMSTAIHF